MKSKWFPKVKGMISLLLCFCMFYSGTYVMADTSDDGLASQTVVAKQIANLSSPQGLLYDDNLSNFTADITYESNENSDSTLYFDAGHDQMSYYEDFSSGNIPDWASDTATLITNSDFPSHGNMLALNDWATTTVYQGDINYETTFYLNNYQGCDWVECKIGLRDNVFLWYTGDKAGTNYPGTAYPGTARQLVLYVNETLVEGYRFSLIDSDSNPTPVRVGCYFNIISTEENIKVYVSWNSDMSDKALAMDIDLSEITSSYGKLSFYHSNTPTWLDDISLYDTNYDKDNILVSEDFSDGIVPKWAGSTAALTTNNNFSSHGNMLALNDWATTTVYQGDINYDATFYLNSYQGCDWAECKIGLRDNVFLWYTGDKAGSNYPGTAGKLVLYVNETLVEGYGFSLIDSDVNPTPVDLGCYFNIISTEKNIKVYVSWNSDMSDKALAMDIDLSEIASSYGKLSFYHSNTPTWVDDIIVKSTSEADVYYSDGVVSVNSGESVELADGNIYSDYDFYANQNVSGVTSWTEYLLNYVDDKNYIGVRFMSSENRSLALSNLEVNVVKDGEIIASDSRVVSNNDLTDNTTETQIYIQNRGNVLRIWRWLAGEEMPKLANIIFALPIGISEGKILASSNNSLMIITDYTITDYTTDYANKSINKIGYTYNAVKLFGTTIKLTSCVHGTETELAVYDNLAVNVVNQIKVVRYQQSVKIFVCETEVISAEVPYDNSCYMGKLYLDNDTSVSNVILYDSGKIIFKDGVPVIEQLKLSDSISVLTTSKSSVTPTITQTDNSIKLTYGSSSANVGVVSTNWFAEEVGDFDLRFKITVSLPSYTYQSFNFAADNDTVVNSTDCAWNHGINIIPNGYNLRFGMGAEYSNISYGLYRVENSRATISEPGYKSPYMYNAGYEYVVRIVKKAEKIQVYLYRGHSEQSEIVMLQQWSDYSYAKGGFYWWLRDGCGGSTVTDITLYDTANYEVVESVAEVRYAAEAKALAEEIVTRVDSEVTMDAYSDESIEMVKNKANAVLSLGDEEITIETYSDLKEAYLYFIKSIDFSTNLYVFSDSHTAKLSDYLVRADKTEVDAIISSGDNTNLGSEFEYYMFINNFQRVLATEKWRDKLLIATGNHDLGECARASETNKVYQGVADIHLNSLNHSGYFFDDLGNIYYAQTINNCRIIVLGTQSPNLQWYPKYSDEQLAWLDSELDVYSGKMPTFVINHWKLEASYWKSNSGTALSAITDILSKYPNVFYISGHSHNPITSRQMIFYPSGSGKYQITNINLPSICEDGNVSFYISVSDDYLLVRPYSGEEGEFITSYDTLIKLQKSNIIGDVNGDFDINSLDLTSLRKHMLKVENADNPDVNDDSEVDIRDLVRLKKMLTSQTED